MGINDFGGLNQPLSNPPLGGPQGWAQSVRDELVSLRNTMQSIGVGNIRGTWTTFQIPANVFPNVVNTLTGTGNGGTVAADGITVTKTGFWLVTVRVDGSAPFPAQSVVDIDQDPAGSGANAYRALIEQGGNTGSNTALLYLNASTKINIGVSASTALSCTGVFTMKWLGQT
jgi:hypothetical protein